MWAVRVGGFQELDRALDTLSKTYSRKFLAALLMESVKPFVKRARQLAARMTGALRKSVRGRLVRKRRRIVSVRAGPGKDEFWGMFQEFGTKHHAARPWMRPAFDDTAEEMLGDVAERMARILDRVAKRIERKVKRGKRLTRFESELVR